MRYYQTLALLLLAGPALAQIAPTSPGRQRAANRQAMREARQADVPYKDSHLSVTRKQLKRGSTETPVTAADEPRFDRSGAPHVTEPKFPGLRKRKKTEPQL